MWTTFHLLDDPITLPLDDKRELINKLILLCFKFAREYDQIPLHSNVGVLKDVSSEIIGSQVCIRIVRLLSTRVSHFRLG